MIVAACSGCGRPQTSTEAARSPRAAPVSGEAEASRLRPLSAFDGLAAGPERAQAMFAEASRVLLHPRCVNCHVQGDSPAQGARFELHEPPVVRGPDDRGVVGMECTSCHQDRNPELSRVPGAPDWRLPPRSMAWVGRSPRELCEQLKDPERNGRRTLAEVVTHTSHDAFVAWGWAPGAEREPAPGSQEEFAALMGGWVNEGAECPPESEEQP